MFSQTLLRRFIGVRAVRGKIHHEMKIAGLTSSASAQTRRLFLYYYVDELRRSAGGFQPDPRCSPHVGPLPREAGGGFAVVQTRS